MSTKLPLDLKDDHVERLTATKRPLNAVLELVWNSLDANATEVAIDVTANDLGGVDRITVTDNGYGIDPDRVEELFRPLGGSWKKQGGRTPSGRVLHGSKGQGRLKAFGVGEQVQWDTCFETGEGMVSYTIAGRATNLKASMESSDPVKARHGAVAGTKVTVTNLFKPSESLLESHAHLELGERLAIYLAAYPGITITYNGKEIDPDTVIQHRYCKELDCSDLDTVDDATLTIIEWTHKPGRVLYLCDSRGAALDEEPPGIQAPGFNFTAYLESSYIGVLSKSNLLDQRQMLPIYMTLLDRAKAIMREHFEERKAEQIRFTVKKWQEDEVYPYDGEASDPIEIVERQVFDVAASYVTKHVEDFEGRDRRGRKLTFSLLKQALERSPESLVKILEEVLELPKRQRDDFARLLNYTSLSAIINASKTVHDRLTFIEALACITTDKSLWPHLKEIGQLHRIMAENTWVIGEEYHLMVDEGGLTTVLREVIKDQDLDVTIDPVKVPGSGGNGSDKSGRVDLMFGRADRHSGGRSKRYLVVELKRPSVVVSDKELSQCRRYGYTLANHPRFKGTDTVWDIMLITQDIDQIAETSVRTNGLVQDYVDVGGQFRVWCKRWSQVIREAAERHEFYRSQLEVEISSDDALAHLKQTYSEYLPDAVDDVLAKVNAAVGAVGAVADEEPLIAGDD